MREIDANAEALSKILADRRECLENSIDACRLDNLSD